MIHLFSRLITYYLYYCNYYSIRLLLVVSYWKLSNTFVKYYKYWLVNYSISSPKRIDSIKFTKSLCIRLKDISFWSYNYLFFYWDLILWYCNSKFSFFNIWFCSFNNSFFFVDCYYAKDTWRYFDFLFNIALF